MYGRTTHWLPKNTNNQNSGMYFFLYDDGNEKLLEYANKLNGGLTDPNNINYRVRPDLLQQVYDEQKITNKFCHQIFNAAQVLRDYNRNDRTIHTVLATLSRENQGLDVFAVTADNATDNMVLLFKSQSHTDRYNHMDIKNKECDAMLFPLLFPYGDGTWSFDSKNALSYTKYLVSQILRPERKTNGEFLTINTPNPNYTNAADMNAEDQFLARPSNRCQIFSRLFQHYLVQSYSKIQDYKLDFIRANRQAFFGISHAEAEHDTWLNEIVNEDIDRENDPAIEHDRISSYSSPSFLPGSFTGGTRHLSELAKNCLTVVSQLEKPTGFVTVTYSQDWPESKERLGEGQSIFDRPDLACQVFKGRIDAFVHNLRHGKYFDQSKTCYLTWVIEYQHRGLPHAHIVFRLHTQLETDQQRIAFMEEFISARFPDPLPADASPQEIQKHERYIELINKGMTHTCSRQTPNGCKMNGDVCKKKFPFAIAPSCSINAKGYPEYKRCTEADQYVVPHNRQMLEDMECHINCELAANSFSVMYLYGKFQTFCVKLF